MDPRNVLAQHRCIRGRGEGHYTPEEHCLTGDQVSGGQELRRGLQATQTGRTLERGGTPLSLHSGGGPADAHVVCLVNSTFIPPPPQSCPVHPAGGTALGTCPHAHAEASQTAAKRTNLLIPSICCQPPPHPQTTTPLLWDFSVICLILFFFFFLLFFTTME